MKALPLLALLALTACATQTGQTKLDPQLDYTSSSYLYRQNGVLYARATDGHVYWLRSAEQQAGNFNGATVTIPECWVRDDTGPIRCYQRTPRPGQPEFSY